MFLRRLAKSASYFQRSAHPVHPRRGEVDVHKPIGGRNGGNEPRVGSVEGVQGARALRPYVRVVGTRGRVEEDTG